MLQSHRRHNQPHKQPHRQPHRQPLPSCMLTSRGLWASCSMLGCASSVSRTSRTPRPVSSARLAGSCRRCQGRGGQGRSRRTDQDETKDDTTREAHASSPCTRCSQGHTHVNKAGQQKGGANPRVWGWSNHSRDARARLPSPSTLTSRVLRVRCTQPGRRKPSISVSAQHSKSQNALGTQQVASLTCVMPRQRHQQYHRSD